jgi:hypothetical protein
MPRLVGSALTAAAVLLFSVVSFAKISKTDDLTRSLKNSDDFRVRTQAALALGGSGSASAVQPLCGALEDENTTVRAAAAAAIGRLHLGGDDCLERRRKVESNATVKSAIKQAVDVLRSEPEPEFTTQTRFYVAVGKATDNSGRSGDEVDNILRKGMHDAARATENVLLAPATETAALAKKRLAAHKGVKGLLMLPRVAAPQYAEKSLKLRVEVAYFTYPGKSLLGMLNIPLTAQGVRAKNRDIEDQLIVAAAERAIEKVPSFGANVQ